MAKGYLTDQEIDEITAAIYNDDNSSLLKALPQGIEDYNEGVGVKELAEGQEYYIVPQSNVMIRKDGRVLNVKFIRVLKPLWTPNDLLGIVNAQQLRFSEIYKSQHWEFDQKEISRTYASNKWGISITRGYKDVFNELYGK
jgi:hypothetical protein